MGPTAGYKVNPKGLMSGSGTGRAFGLQLRGADFSPCSFHGEVLRSIELDDIRLTEVAYLPNLQNSVHSHANAYIGVTLAGNSTQVCRNQIRSSKPWTVMYHPVGEVHSDHFHAQGAREFNIEIATTRLQKLCEHSHFLRDSVQMHRGKAGWVAARLYGEFRLMDNLSWLAIEGLTIELMAEIHRYDIKPFSTKPLPWLSQVEEIIRNRYTERVTLSELARSVGIHPVHVAREFHRRVGCTIGQQVRKLRIEHACRMLAKDNNSVADIALASGFADQSQFTKTFRNLVGMSPGRFRQVKFRANPCQVR